MIRFLMLFFVAVSAWAQSATLFYQGSVPCGTDNSGNSIDGACALAWQLNQPFFYTISCLSGITTKQITPVLLSSCPACCTNPPSLGSLINTNPAVDGGASTFPLTVTATGATITNIDPLGCAVVQIGTNQTQIVSFSSNAVLTVGSFLGQTQVVDVAARLMQMRLNQSSLQFSNFLASVPTNGDSTLWLGGGGVTGGFANASAIWSNTYVYPYMTGTASNFDDAWSQGWSNTVSAMPGSGTGLGPSSRGLLYGGNSGSFASDISSALESNGAFEDGNAPLLVTDISRVRDPNLVIDLAPAFNGMSTNAWMSRFPGVGGSWKFNLDPLQFKGMRFVILIFYFVASVLIFKWGIDQKLEIIDGWVKLSSILTLKPGSTVGVDPVKDVLHWIKKGLENGASVVLCATIFSFLALVLDAVFVFKGMVPTSSAVLGASRTVGDSVGGTMYSAVPTGSSIWESALVLLYLLFPVRMLFTVVFEIWALKIGLMSNFQLWLNRLLTTLAQFL